MPKLNQSITQREIGICERVNFARKELIKWSQPNLAKALGITQNQLAGIEYKRAPLRLGPAKIICEQFNINQRWLAVGVLPMQPRYDVAIEYSFGIRGNTQFSWFFDGYLDGETSRIEAEWIKEFGEENFRAGKFDGMEFSLFQPLAAALSNGAFKNISRAIGITYNWLPEDLQIAYSSALVKADEAFRSKHAKKIASLAPPAQRENLLKAAHVDKSHLTHVNECVNNKSVTPKLPNLLERLNKASAQRGKKSALAKFLGVSLVQVSQWLSGDREPGGEITLRLLHWVEQQERQ